MANESKTHGILLASGTNEVEFLVVGLGSQRHGINVSKVCAIQVYEPSLVAPLPHQARSVMGVIPFRDKTISVVDLTLNLGYPVLQEQASKRLLVVTEFNARTTGFVVDSVDRIERYNWSQFEPINDTTAGSGDSSILGSVRTDEGLILILDLETIMAKIDPTMSVEHYASEIGAAKVEREKVRIVHCDDSPLIQKVVAKALVEAGFSSFKQFSNGEETLEYLKQGGKDCVDVLLSDIEMPRMDGLSLCKTLRQDKQFSDTPIVFFSSLISEQMEAKCRSVGGNSAFSKPQINVLVGEIEKLIQDRAGAQR